MIGEIEKNFSKIDVRARHEEDDKMNPPQNKEPKKKLTKEERARRTHLEAIGDIAPGFSDYTEEDRALLKRK